MIVTSGRFFKGKNSQCKNSQNFEVKREQLELKLQNLQRKLTHGDQTISEQYLEAKTKLQQYHLQETATSVLKTKIQYIEEGEKSTRYFYSLE